MALKHTTRKISKKGISLGNTKFWFPEMGLIEISTEVNVWYDPRYGTPEEIIVELPDDAIKFLLDQQQGTSNSELKTLTPEEIDRHRYVIARNKNCDPPSYQEHANATRLQRDFRKWRTHDMRTYQSSMENEPDFPDVSQTTESTLTEQIQDDAEYYSSQIEIDKPTHSDQQNDDDIDPDYLAIVSEGL